MKPVVIINEERLRNFGACSGLRDRFVADHANGFDIGGLYGTDEEAAAVWAVLFASEWKRQIGWAIGVGLLPAKIRADLRWANLRWANLRGADLRGADLSEADLSGASLRGADLSWANLSEANLSEATLRGASLDGANLSWANLRGADLRGANLSGAIWNKSTIWPAGFTPPENIPTGEVKK